jgi:hypothetical protein
VKGSAEWPRSCSFIMKVNNSSISSMSSSSSSSSSSEGQCSVAQELSIHNEGQFLTLGYPTSVVKFKMAVPYMRVHFVLLTLTVNFDTILAPYQVLEY